MTVTSITFKMESKWYFFPGQTVENTKISDRAHALHITRGSWQNITQHLDRKKRLQEAMDKERAHREALKQGSEAMTNSWDNSIQNLRLRKEEERQDRMSKKNEDKIQMFYKMRDEQEAIRKQYVEKVKRDVFVSSGYPKNLTSALILSETLYEQEKQKEFNKQLLQEQKAAKEAFDKRILAADEKNKQEDREKELERREKARAVAQMLRDQVHEFEETKKIANRSRVERERQDRMNAEREFELIKQYEFEEKKRKQREYAMQRKKALQDEHERQKILSKENEEMEKAVEFYAIAKTRIDCLMKQKSKELNEQAIQERLAMAAKLNTIKEAKDAAEDARIAKVVAEADALAKAKAEAKAARLAQAKQERIEDRKQYLKRLESEKHIADEVKRWELLNRCKTDEAMKEYDQQNKKQKWAKMMEYRRDLLEQMVDDKEIQKHEKEIDEILSHVSYEDDDKMFFEYANEVLNLAKNKNRSTYPIEKVIAEYKRFNNLVPKDRHCRCCKK